MPVDCDAQVQANAMRLELNLMIQAEVERVEHAAMMAAAWNQPAYLGLAHPDPVSVQRSRTARYLFADLGIGGNSRWRGDWSRSRMWEPRVALGRDSSAHGWREGVPEPVQAAETFRIAER